MSGQSTPDGVIRRTTLSAPLSWMLTYVCVRSASRQGRFRVLHPNAAVRSFRRCFANCCVKGILSCGLRTTKYAPLEKGAFALLFIRISPSGKYVFPSANNIVKTPVVDVRVRLSTLLSIPQALSLHFIEISPSGYSGVIRRTTLSAPLSWMLTYVCVRSASRQGRFRVLHPNAAVSELAFVRASQGTMVFFGDGFTRRSAKRSQAVQPPLERRGAQSECRAPTKH